MPLNLDQGGQGGGASGGVWRQPMGAPGGGPGPQGGPGTRRPHHFSSYLILDVIFVLYVFVWFLHIFICVYMLVLISPVLQPPRKILIF